MSSFYPGKNAFVPRSHLIGLRPGLEGSRPTDLGQVLPVRESATRSLAGFLALRGFSHSPVVLLAV